MARFILHSYLLLAITAVMLAKATTAGQGLKLQDDVLFLFLFFATLADYNMHRYIKTRYLPNGMVTESADWAGRHNALIKVLIIISLLASAISVLFLKKSVISLLLPLAAITLLYSITAIKSVGFSKMLPSVPGVKIIILALVWTCATVLLPFAAADHAIQPGSFWMLMAERFTFIFAVAIPFEIRDRETDTMAGIKTLAVALGEKKALRLSNIMLLFSFLIALQQYGSEGKIGSIAAYGISVIFTLALINIQKFRQLQYYLELYLDGSILFHATVIYLSAILL